MSELQPRHPGGRPQEDIPQVVIEKIRAYTAEHKRAPSSNWVYKLTREMLPTGGFSRGKIKRALDIAASGMEVASAVSGKRPKPKRCHRCKIILETIGDPPTAKYCHWCKEEMARL